MKKLVFIMPLMAISVLASCNNGGGDKPEQVEFMPSSEQPITVEGKDAKVSVDWKPTDHAIKFDSFTFTTEQNKVDKVTFDKESEARPMPVTITFEKDITESINGTLSFAYEDVTTKTKGESSLEITIDKPLNRWYTYEDWWNYCSNGNADSEATPEDIGKEVDVTVYGLNHKVRLIDVNHKNVEGEEPEAHCTFEFANLITNSNGAVTIEWNIKEPETDEPNKYNNYNFPNSTLNDFLNADDGIFTKLPSGLQGAIKEVNKKVGLGSSYSTDTPYKTKLFPLAHDEVNGHTPYVPVGEGTIYQYYKDHPDDEDRIKTAVDSNDESEYWLRSPCTHFETDAWRITYEGASVSYYGDRANAVAPAFCI